jgi:hypothetical protein
MAALRRLLIVVTLPMLMVAVIRPLGASGALFSSYSAIELRLKAPFEDLFKRGRATDTYGVSGVLSYTDQAGREATIDGVKITLRGHTSMRESECVFPKLKLEFDERARAQDPMFAGIKTLKLGTHCGEGEPETLTARFGRLPNEHSPLREAFVYRLLDTLGVPSLKARPARITYVFTDARADGQAGGETLVRNAMLLEDDDAAIARFGTKEIPEAAFTNARDAFKVEDAARLAFAEALIGNFDWCVRFYPEDRYRCDARHPLWNVLAVQSRDGRAIPVMYDFDVTGMVTGRHAWFGEVYNEAFIGSRSHAEIEVLGQVQRTRTLFPRAVLDATRAEFVKRKADAYHAFEDAPLDPSGRRRIREYLDSFFGAIESDEAFYRPVVTARDVMAFTTPDRAAAVCPAQGPVPEGTPVSQPLDTRGEMVQVILLDALWRWPPGKCPAIQKGAVWIEKSAIGSDFPSR